MKVSKKAEKIYEQARDMGWSFVAYNGYAILMVRFQHETVESRTGATFKTIMKNGKVYYNKEAYDKTEKES